MGKKKGNQVSHTHMEGILGDDDLLLEILKRCAVRDVLCVLSTCRECRASSERVLSRVAHDMWGGEFWSRASRRPHAHTFVSWRDELQRIERFQRAVERLGCRRWTADTFFAFWDAEELSRRQHHHQSSIS